MQHDKSPSYTPEHGAAESAEWSPPERIRATKVIPAWRRSAKTGLGHNTAGRMVGATLARMGQLFLFLLLLAAPGGSNEGAREELPEVRLVFSLSSCW